MIKLKEYSTGEDGIGFAPEPDSLPGDTYHKRGNKSENLVDRRLRKLQKLNSNNRDRIAEFYAEKSYYEDSPLNEEIALLHSNPLSQAEQS